MHIQPSAPSNSWSGVAAQAAVAMDNARLYEAAQREIASRERAEATLRETDQRKDEFLATLAHELRNPLAPIRQAALISMAPEASEAQKRWSHEVISTAGTAHMPGCWTSARHFAHHARHARAAHRDDRARRRVDAAVETSRPASTPSSIRSRSNTARDRAFRRGSVAARAGLVESLTNAAKYTDPAALSDCAPSDPRTVI